MKGRYAEAHRIAGEEPEENGYRPVHPTDQGNAERLADREGENLRYVHGWRRWLVADGQRWKPDDTGEVVRRAKRTVKAMFHEADPGNGRPIDKELAKHAMRSESKGNIEAMIALAQSEPGIPVTPDQLDRDPWLLNCENGTLDLRTGQLREHRREDLITKLVPVEYDPEAEAPTWEAFLERVLPSEAVRTFVRRAVGYSLTGDTRERILIILHGTGRNGKSTFLEAIREVMGDYALKTPAETLMAKPAGGIPNDLARLKDARFVSASETEANRRLAEALVKEITGQDTISARFMRAEWFDFKPTHKTWLATNHKPVIQGTDPAIWDRIKLVPFEVRIPDEEIDRELPEKLRAERPGILAWAVRGCEEWRCEGLGEPKEVRVATEGYRAEMDVLAAFISECCVTSPGVWVEFKDLWSAYTRWCEDSNERAEKKRRFADLLTERGFEKAHGTRNVAIRRGIALRHDGDPDPSRVNDPDSQGGPEPRPDPPEAGEIINSSPTELTIGNSQKPRKSADSEDRVNDGYRRSRITAGADSHERLCRNNVNHRSLVNPVGDDATPRGESSRRLTDDEVQRVRRLVREGMSPELARASVLGEAV